ncbi:MAG: beta-lactamase family protein [Bacteroidales bacterium]|nr:beta-lactamase family protein [Bacteroidales bacterium]
MKRLFRLLLIISVVSLAACKKTPQVDNGASVLQRFAFNCSDNNGFIRDAVAIQENSHLFITVQEDADLTRLVPDIRVVDGAKVYIDNVLYEKGKEYDFSGNSQTITVVLENGNKKMFFVQLRKGDADIDNLVYDYMRKYSVPAVSISYAHHEHEAYTAAYGYPVWDYSWRCTPETLFRIAGVSQSLCAICIMTCKENGLLSLDDTAIGPGGILECQNTSFDKIKVKHLLSHCSGLNDSDIRNNDFSVNAFVAAMGNNSLYDILKFDNPGESFLYSEYGYGILQRIVEVVSHKPYAEYLDWVMAMAGIRSIQVGENSKAEVGGKECVYYAYDIDENPYMIDVSDKGGAIGVIATPRDLTRLLMSIDSGTAVPDILSPESVGEMFSPFPYLSGYPKYGYGWYSDRTASLKNAYYNYATMSGSTALCAIFPETGICASLTCNYSYPNNLLPFREDTEHLFAAIADIINRQY